MISYGEKSSCDLSDHGDLHFVWNVVLLTIVLILILISPDVDYGGGGGRVGEGGSRAVAKDMNRLQSCFLIIVFLIVSCVLLHVVNEFRYFGEVLKTPERSQLLYTAQKIGKENFVK